MSVEEIFEYVYAEPKEYTWEELLASVDYSDTDIL